MVQSAAAPTDRASAVTSVSWYSSAPSAAWRNCLSSTSMGLPVHERAHDVHDQRGEQREGQWNVDVEPQAQPSLQLNIASNPAQHGLAAAQQHDQGLKIAGLGALGRLRHSLRHLIDDTLLIGIA